MVPHRVRTFRGTELTLNLVINLYPSEVPAYALRVHRKTVALEGTSDVRVDVYQADPSDRYYHSPFEIDRGE